MIICKQTTGCKKARKKLYSSSLISLGFVLSSVLVWPFNAALAEDNKQNNAAGAALQTCRAINTDAERLHCYDSVAKQFAPPTYKGKLGSVTEPFTLDAPHKIRYRSYGFIFVLYVLDDNDNIVQNLHLGGRGEDEYILEVPGTYSLRIDGSAGWEIWLEPLEDG